MKLLTQILTILLCLSVSGLSLATPMGVLDCCQNLVLTAEKVDHSNHSQMHQNIPTHGGDQADVAHSHADHRQSAQPVVAQPVAAQTDGDKDIFNQWPLNNSADNKAFPFSDTCGLIMCLKAPTASFFSITNLPLIPANSAILSLENSEMVFLELPDSIFRPPRPLTI